MEHSSARPSEDIDAVVRNYGNMVFRICLVMLGNEADAEDAVQETFLKYMQKAPVFTNSEHEKAWLITVASNQCRDMLRFRRRSIHTDLNVIKDYAPNRESSRILEALMSLPDKFKIVLTLYYVEEYRIEDIAELIGRTSSAVKMRLQKGRKLLEETYRKEFM